MKRQANLTSIDAVRQSKLALADFEATVRDALVQLQLEVRRAVEWMENDRARYWPREVRRASEAVIEARLNLERCQMSITAGDERPCYDERKIWEKARRRLAYAEEKVRAVRRWQLKVKHEADEFEVQLARTTHFLDTDFPRALARLEQMAIALDKYAARSAPRETGTTEETQ